MTSSLQIPNTPPFIRYTGNGTQTAFHYPFPIFHDSDLLITINGDTQNGNYTVSQAGKTHGGIVTFHNPPQDQAIVALERRLPLQRLSDFLEGGELSANALNAEFDYLMACAQQVQHDTGSALHFSKSDLIAHTQIPDKNARTNKVLGFDGNGALTVYETSETYAAPSITQSGHGAIARPMDDKLKDIVSAKDFGAIGDGIADDTAAIQNALDSHAAVHLPAGVYRITQSIEIGDDKTLYGTGNASVLYAGTRDFDAVAMIGSHAVLRDLSIRNAETGIRLYGKNAPCRHNSLSRLHLDDCITGIELDGFNDPDHPCAYHRCDRIVIRNASLHGIHLTRSNIGTYPHHNHFSHIVIDSADTSMTGCGVYFESARFNNTLENADIIVPGTAIACIRIGSESTKTLLRNIRTQSTNQVVNIRLDNGSQETAITDLLSQSDGMAIYDLSNGDYTAINAGYPDKTRLNKTRIVDLTIEQQRHSFDTVSFATPQTLAIDLHVSTYMVNAALAVTTLELPKASDAHSGAIVTIKKTDASANAVIIRELDGAGPDGKECRLGSPHDVATFLCDGMMWRSMAGNMMAQNTAYVATPGVYKPDITRTLHVIDATSGAITVELPPANAASSIGRSVTIKKTDASANNVTITVEGGNGPDNANKTITARYHAYTMMSDGNLWHITARVN